MSLQVSGVLALLCRARVYIQGYFFDRYERRSVDLRSRVAVVTGCTVGGLGVSAVSLCKSYATLEMCGTYELHTQALQRRRCCQKWVRQ